VADGKTLVEILAPITPAAQLVFMLMAAVEGRADAVKLHGLGAPRDLGSPYLGGFSAQSTRTAAT